MSETDVRPPPASPAQPAYRTPVSAPEASPGDAWVAPEVEAAPRPARKRPVRWPWIVAGVAGAGALVWFCTPIGKPASQAGAGQAGAQGGRGAGGRGGRGGGMNMPTVVGAARAEVGDVPITLDEIGTVTPTQTAVVRSQLSGQLLKIAFTEGQFVRAGQVLAQVDPRPYQQALAQAEGTLARDQAQLNNARVDLNRYQTLLKEDSIASQQVDTQAALVRQYEGTIKTDQAAIGSARVNLAYTRVTAPFSGRVGLRAVDAGNFVTAGDTNGIVSISQVDPIDVLFTIPQDNLPAVAKRLRSGATLTATAFDRDRTQTLASGRLLTFDNAVDVSTGTVRAKARFPNGNSALFPSQFVNVRLLVDTLKGVVTAPSGAVLRGSQGQFVYVVDLSTRKVKIRPIKTGAIANDRIAVLEGLQAGEVIVTDGTDRLRDGACAVLPGDRVPNMGGGGRGGRRGGAGPQAGGAGGGGGFGPGAAGTGGGRAGGGASGPGGGAPGAGGAAGGFGGKCPNAGKPWDGPPAAQDGAGAASGAPGGVFGGGTQPQRQINPAPGAAAPAAGAPAPQGRAPAGLRPAVAAPAVNAPTSPAPAQPGAGAQAGGQGGGGSRMLDMLGLDAGQKAKAQAIFARHPPEDPDDPDSVREARRAAMAELVPILRPDQKAKFDAFRAQMRARMGGGGGGR